MTRYAVIKDGSVINVVEWDGNTANWCPPAGCTVVPSEVASIGGTYDGSQFSEPTNQPADPWADEIALLRDYVTDNGLTAYLDNPSPTNAQTLQVVKGTAVAVRTLLRVLYRILP